MSSQDPSRSVELVSAGSAGQTQSETRAEATPIIIYQTPKPQADSTNTVQTTSTTGSNGLTAGWIVAIVALILLAMSLTFLTLKWWLDRRRRRAQHYSEDRYRPQSEYFEVTKPPRARRRSSVFPRSGRYY